MLRRELAIGFVIAGFLTVVVPLHFWNALFLHGHGYAIDPMCGMQVRIGNAPAQRKHDDRDVYFCSDHCAERFDATPAASVGASGEEADVPPR